MSTYDTAFRLGVTAGLWIAWCVVHSLLATESLIRKIGIPDSRIEPFYRLIYSLFAVLSLILVSVLTPRCDAIVLWTWEGGLRLLQIALWLVALTVAGLSFRMIGIGGMLGFCALGICKKYDSQADVLITWGIYGVLIPSCVHGNMISTISVGADQRVCPDLGAHTGAPLPTHRTILNVNSYQASAVHGRACAPLEP